MYCNVLYCTALYCTVLYCTILYCTMIYYAMLYYVILHYNVLYCTVLYCTVLCYAMRGPSRCSSTPSETGRRSAVRRPCAHHIIGRITLHYITLYI